MLFFSVSPFSPEVLFEFRGQPTRLINNMMENLWLQRFHNWTSINTHSHNFMLWNLSVSTSLKC